MDLAITDFNDGYPRRRPWLIIVIVLLLAGLMWLLLSRCEDGVEEQGDEAARDTADDTADETAAAIVVEEPIAEPVSDAAITDGDEVVAVDKPAPDSQAAGKLVLEARKFESDGYLLSARKAYLAALDGDVSPALRSECETRLSDIHMRLIFSDLPMPEKRTYVVRGGDALSRIARKFGTTSLLIQKSNGISNPRRIRPGQELSVLAGKFSLKVSKTRRDMVLLLNDRFCKKYGVGIGRDNRTPVGTFVVRNKLVEPKWYRRDGAPVPFGSKENILGTRWMSIMDAKAPEKDTRGFGIHGTWDNDSIGKAVSRGCIRMRNKDVEELFVLIPEGTLAEIQD